MNQLQKHVSRMIKNDIKKCKQNFQKIERGIKNDHFFSKVWEPWEDMCRRLISRCYEISSLLSEDVNTEIASERTRELIESLEKANTHTAKQRLAELRREWESRKRIEP